MANETMNVLAEVHVENDLQSDQSIETQEPAGQSTNEAVLEEIRKLSNTFSSELKTVSERVDRLAETVYNPPAPKKRRTAESATPSVHTAWHERRDSGVRAPLPSFRDSDDESDVDGERDDGTRELSESSKSLIKSAFSNSIPNAERRKIRAQFPHSGMPQTRCPKLDPVFKSASGKAETKTVDAELSKIQAFVLDPIGPLLQLLEQLQQAEGGAEDDTENEISLEEAAHTLQEAIRLIGNTSVQISTIRRKKVLSALNPEIKDLATEEEHFKEAAPQLFGQGFEKVMKERAESIRILQKASKPTTSSQGKKFFPKGRSTAPQRGGGQNQQQGRKGNRWQQRRPSPANPK